MSVSGDNTSPDIGPEPQPPPLPSPSPAHTRRRHPRWFYIAGSVAGGIAMLALAFSLLAPPLAKSVLEKQLSKNLSTPEAPREAQVGRVRINPFALSCTVENLSVTGPGREPLVRWRNLHASLDLRTLFTREWRFRKIALDGFGGRITVAKDGQLNFADLLPAAHAGNARQPAAASRPLHINQLVVTDAHLAYSDDSLPQPFATSLGPMSFSVRDFQTGGPDRAPGEFTAATESGETLAWQGTLGVAPLASRGEIRIGNLSIKKYTPFYGRHVRFDVLAGTLDIALHYDIATTNNGSLAARAVESGITLHDVQLAERDQTTPAIAVGTVDIAGISIDTQNASADMRRTLRVERLTFEKGSLTLRRDIRGISLARLFSAADTPPVPPVPTTVPPQTVTLAGTGANAAPQFEIAVGELRLRDISLGLEDATLEKTMRTEIDIDSFDAKNFSLEKLDTPISLDLAARLPEGGQLHASGELSLSPLRGVINADLTAAPLTLAREHVGNIINARIDNGRASAKAVVTIDPAKGVIITADAGMTGVSASDPASGGTFLSWKQLDLRGIAFATTPRAGLAVREISLDGATAQLSLQSGGKLNLASLIKQSRPETSAPAATATNPASIFVAIGKISLANSRVDFSDQAIQPAVELSLDEINGTVANLSSEIIARADVDLHARINDAAPVSLTGRINPPGNDAHSDLTLTVRDAQLAPLGAYLAKYAGRSLARGTLSVDVRTKVSSRFLDSSNVITLNQFELGEHINSPDATNLPVGLAVALLRDREGKIVLDVPVKGSLDDPDFKYGRAVWRAVGNLLVKAAAAPFTLLTALAGGAGTSEAGAPAYGGAEEKDFSFAEFDAGGSSPNAEGRRKLRLVAKALRERPALQLAISGGYDADSDREALRHALLFRQLKREYWAELGGQNSTPPFAAPEQMELSPDSETRMVERLYQRTFLVEERADLSAQQASRPPRVVAEVVPPGSLDRLQETFLAGGKTSPGRRSITPLRPNNPAGTTSSTAIAAGTGAATTENIPKGPLPSHEEMRARLLETIQIHDDQLRLLASVRAESVKDFLVGEGVEPNRIALADAATAKGAVANLDLR